MVYLFVGIGGVIGALLRYYLGVTIGLWWDQTFPLATLLANLIGCFVLGWVTAFLFKVNLLHSNVVSGIGTGMVGSFTTFSTFSVETVELLQTSQLGAAILYVLTSLWIGLYLSWLGFRFGELALTKRKAACIGNGGGE